MSPEKQQILFDRYPALFRERNLPMTQTCMCWRIEAQGDGWFQLLDTLCARIEAIKAVVPGLDVAFGQVKSKFGELRAYRGIITAPSDVWAGIIDALIENATTESCRTCEETGEYGSTHYSPSGWVRTLSAAKAKELGYLSEAEYRAQWASDKAVKDR